MIVFSLSGSVPFLFASLRFPRFPPSSDSRKEEANSGRPFRDEWLKWLSAKDCRDDSLCRPGFLVSNSGRLRPLSGGWTISLDWALTLSSSEREYEVIFDWNEFPSSGRPKDSIVIPILFVSKRDWNEFRVRVSSAIYCIYTYLNMDIPGSFTHKLGKDSFFYRSFVETYDMKMARSSQN